MPKLMGMLGLMVLSLGAGALSTVGPATGASLPVSPPGEVEPPGSDPFYTPPSPLPAVPPGTVIRSRSVTVRPDPAGLLPAPVRAWQVLYRSTSALGAPVAVSGTVMVPEGPPEVAPELAQLRPLVTYAIGTHGLGDQCAPSYELRSGREGEAGLMNQALSRGWAVVVTDYEALGTPGTHTYAVGVAEGRAVLDAARAARNLREANLDPAGPVGIWGYSQGGQAASWAAEQQPAYAPELPVVGVAAGGVPADLEAVVRFIDGGAAAGLVLAGAVGYGAAYPELPLDTVLTAEGKAAAARMAESCTEDIVAAGAFRRIADYSTIPDPLAEPHFAARLAENRLGGNAPAVPAVLYHGTTDELIPLPVARQLQADWCGRGVAVQFHELPPLGHVQAAVAGAPLATAWLADRFAGTAAPSSC